MKNNFTREVLAKTKLKNKNTKMVYEIISHKQVTLLCKNRSDVMEAEKSTNICVQGFVLFNIDTFVLFRTGAIGISISNSRINTTGNIH